MPWHPVIDGDLIPARTIDRITAGASGDIDLMVGSTTDEWRLFLVLYGVIDHITDSALAGAAAAYGLPVDAALRTYRASRPGANAGDLLAALQSDWYVRIPAIRLAEAHAPSPAATHMYEFAWPTPSGVSPFFGPAVMTGSPA
jgi:carboxylesterase type B